jgi:hypothetical protein
VDSGSVAISWSRLGDFPAPGAKNRISWYLLERGDISRPLAFSFGNLPVKAANGPEVEISEVLKFGFGVSKSFLRTKSRENKSIIFSELDPVPDI